VTATGKQREDPPQALTSTPAEVENGGMIETDPDQDLVRRWKQGDATAGSELARHHYRLVFWVTYRILKCKEDAEDATQQTFVKATLRIDGFEERSPFRPWLLRIATNTALDAKRHRDRNPAKESTNDPVGEDQKEELGDRLSGDKDDPTPAFLDTSAIMRALAQLKEDELQAFVMRHVEGIAYSEMAAMLGLTEDGVRGRVHRAVVHLREMSCLAEIGGGR
jgi:RNA polymerase sigma-70 factor, ECF subfamily